MKCCGLRSEVPRTEVLHFLRRTFLRFVPHRDRSPYFLAAAACCFVNYFSSNTIEIYVQTLKLVGFYQICIFNKMTSIFHYSRLSVSQSLGEEQSFLLHHEFISIHTILGKPLIKLGKYNYQLTKHAFNDVSPLPLIHIHSEIISFRIYAY